MKTWKTSRDPGYAARKARVEHLYAIADGEVIPEDGEPEVVFCLDEFGPLNLQPHPGGSLRPGHGQALRPHQADETPHTVPLPAQPAPARDPHRDRAGQLLPTPEHEERHPGRRLSGGQQRRVCLHADQQLLTQPHRGQVHRPALRRAGRYQPRQPRGTGQHEPSIHHLAEQERRQ